MWKLYTCKILKNRKLVLKKYCSKLNFSYKFLYVIFETKKLNLYACGESATCTAFGNNIICMW